MFEDKNINNNIINWRVFTFCLIIIQSIGIRFFSGQGTLLSLIIIILSYRSLYLLTFRDYNFLFISTLFLLTCKIFNPSSFSLSSLVFQISLIFSTYLFIIQYRRYPNLIQKEFFTALTLFAYHAILGYIIYLIIPGKFVSFNGMNNTFAHLFYVSSGDFMGFKRNTGLFWEPGVFQLVMNLYLFYCIKFKKNFFHIISGILIVLSSFSTVGLVILTINFGYYFYVKYKSGHVSFSHIAVIIFTLILFVPILKGNTIEKINGENTSGLVRLRDMIVGIDLIKEKPILGHGKFESDYLKTKSYVTSTEGELFSEEYLEITGDMGGGYTNGLLGLIAWYGIPVSFLIYFFYFKNRFVGNDITERVIYCLIPLLSMISEPIAYTSLFLMFPLSYWILNVKYKTLKQNINL